MKKEMTVQQATRKMDMASAKHDRLMYQKRKLFNKFINANSYKASERAAKKLKHHEEKMEHAWHAFIVSIKRLTDLS